jgi:hypothetical protein
MSALGEKNSMETSLRIINPTGTIDVCIPVLISYSAIPLKVINERANFGEETILNQKIDFGEQNLDIGSSRRLKIENSNPFALKIDCALTELPGSDHSSCDQFAINQKSLFIPMKSAAILDLIFHPLKYENEPAKFSKFTAKLVISPNFPLLKACEYEISGILVDVNFTHLVCWRFGNPQVVGISTMLPSMLYIEDN